MNRLSTIRNLALTLVCSLLALSCSQDEDSDVLPAGEHPMTFNASVEGAKSTKSTSSNTWDSGDEVAVDVGGTVKKYAAAANGILTAANGVQPFYWQTSSEEKFVTAWYPYSAAAPTSWTVKADQSAADYQASDFLYAPITGISFANRENERFKFYHQTAKVVINIVNGEAATNASDITGVTIGYVANLALSGDYSVPTGPATTGTWSNLSDMGVVTPQEFTPTGTYLKSYSALVIPQDMTGKKFIAVTLSNGNTYYYTPTGTDAGLIGGKEHTYTITVKNGFLDVQAVTGGQWTNEGEQPVTGRQVKEAYTATDLKPGDYYYSDGTWSDGGLRRMHTDGTGGGAGTVDPVGGKTVVGIVFWVGDPTEGNHYNGTTFTDFGDPALKAEHPSCTHGLVVALQDASVNAIIWQDTPSAIGDAGTAYETIATNSGANDALHKLRGYNNTQVIRTYNSSVSSASPNLVLPVQDIDTWAKTHPAPANSSGWYLPSEKELTLLCGRDVNDIYLNGSGGTGMRDIVNASISKAGATVITPDNYGSSTESAYNTILAFCVYFDTGFVQYLVKQFSTYRVRSVLAF